MEEERVQSRPEGLHMEEEKVQSRPEGLRMEEKHHEVASMSSSHGRSKNISAGRGAYFKSRDSRNSICKKKKKKSFAVMIE